MSFVSLKWFLELKSKVPVYMRPGLGVQLKLRYLKRGPWCMEPLFWGYKAYRYASKRLFPEVPGMELSTIRFFGLKDVGIMTL